MSTIDGARILGALAGHPTPLAFIDLDAVDHNAQVLLSQAASLPIRIASKSLRCTAVLQSLLASNERFCGAMAFTVPEALHLARAGVHDVLLGYPAVEPTELRALAEWQAEHPSSVIRLMIDSTEHLARTSAAAHAAGTELRVCLDLDTAWRPLGRRQLAIGARRSPIRTAADALEIVDAARRFTGVRLDGLMAYDAQVAGLGDAPPGRPLRAHAIRLIHRRSLSDLHARVPRIIEAVEAALAPEGGLALVNVGGTGSLTRIGDLTGATELTAGSGFYAPTLFDTYRHLKLRPAAGFVLSVVRTPAPGVATLLGGGYVASGAAGLDRLPTPSWPSGLALDANEGAGEVQTPLRGPGAAQLAIGDRVILRHAKAGELCERFAEVHLIRGDAVERTVPTYRGEGHCFL